MLSENKYSKYALLTEITQEFMHLKDEKAPVGHCIKVAVEAVNYDNASVIGFDAVTDIGRKFTWREFCRIDLLQSDD